MEQTEINPTVQVLPQPVAAMPTQVAEQGPASQQGGQVPVIPLEMSKPRPKLSKKLVLAALGIVVALVLVGATVFVFMRGGVGVGGIMPIASITPSPTVTPTAAPLSPYVNDPEVLQIEEDLKALDTKLNTTDLREDTLRVPILEWNVKF